MENMNTVKKNLKKQKWTKKICKQKKLNQLKKSIRKTKNKSENIHISNQILDFTIIYLLFYNIF